MSHMTIDWKDDQTAVKHGAGVLPCNRVNRRRTRSVHRAERQRAAKLLESEFEYIDSPEFDDENAAEAILAEMPVEDEKIKQVQPPADTPPYLADLYRIPLLTRAQEHHLFWKMNFLKYRAEQLRRQLSLEDPQVGLMDQIERLRDDALDVRNRIVSCNLRLVVSIAKTLVDVANPLEELISDGNVPLIRAVEIFDFERGTRLSTYATWAVRNCLFRSTKRNRRLRGRQRTGHDVVFDSVPETRNSIRFDEAFHRELKTTVQGGLKFLEPRDRRIVAARFALDGSERPQKFREIAADLNLSTERVRQLLARSLMRLNESLDGCVSDAAHQAV